MKKKVITIAMLAALAVGSVVSLTACGGGGDSGSSAVESSAPASSAAEVVSSEAAAPSSQTASDYIKSLPEKDLRAFNQLAKGLTVADGYVVANAKTVADRFEIYAKVVDQVEPVRRTDLPNESTLTYDDARIEFVEYNDLVSLISIKPSSNCSNPAAYWLCAINAIHGSEKFGSYIEQYGQEGEHFKNMMVTFQKTEYVDDWDGVITILHTDDGQYDYAIGFTTQGLISQPE